jgi:hypothetical protein
MFQEAAVSQKPLIDLLARDELTRRVLLNLVMKALCQYARVILKQKKNKVIEPTMPGNYFSAFVQHLEFFRKSQISTWILSNHLHTQKHLWVPLENGTKHADQINLLKRDFAPKYYENTLLTASSIHVAENEA